VIKNYLKIAFRNIARHKAFAFLNVFGLAIGMAACILLFIVVRYESSYDRFLPGHESIYHIITEDKRADGIDYTPGIPSPALDALRVDMPDITTGVLNSAYGSQITVLGKDPNKASGKKFIEETATFFGDPEFFKVFPYQWSVGSPAVLAEPNVTALTKKMADKYFGNWKDAVGQYIKLDNAITFRVAGIIEDVPANSDFPLGVVSSYVTLKNYPEQYSYSPEWGSTSSSFQLFMKLPSGLTASQVDKRLATFSRKVYKSNSGNIRTNMLQPLSEIHFDKRVENFGDHTISKTTLWTLSLIGVFIIIMACINFINLSTAQAVTRSKEIGIRKVLGSNRSSLFWQMMGETGVIVFGAAILSLLLAALALPYIKHVASITESLTVFTPVILGFVALTALVVTFFSGSYPALIVSGFRPLLALKNKVTSASIGGISLRRGLVVLQFAISQVLIIGTIVAVSQMSFVRHADLGFNKDAVLLLNSTSDSSITSKQYSFKQELLGINGVQSVSFSSDAPSSENNWGSNFAFNHKDDEKFTLYLKYADEDYFKTFGLQFVAGQPFQPSDTVREFVINETLVAKLGLKNPADAIGKDIQIGGDTWRKITGVVKDFKTNSLRDATKPLLIASRREYYSNSAIKIRSTNIAGVRETVQKTWDKYYPEYATTVSFMDENVENFYRQETQLSLLYRIFAGIAVLISCLGLYGLVSFMAVQKVKEVGVRKVLGASVANIVYLFSKEFTILILVAFAVAAPIAWFLMNSWLSNFAYRVDIGAGVFILAVGVSVIVAWLTVGYKSIKAASANPVKSLRSE
jgi:putative ABC transport system permease protein